MNKMNKETRSTVVDYLEQGDNVFRVASVLDVPLEWVKSIEREIVQTQMSGWFLTVDGTKVYQEFPGDMSEDICYG